MSAILSSAVGASKSAAAAAAGLLAAKVGSSIPSVPIKEDDPTKSFAIPTAGKIVIVGYPGAFTPTCSDQVPSYISNYDAFAAKGVTDIYAIAINDVFVQKAFKQKLAPEGTKVRFVADSDNGFLASLGLVFDASGLLGGIRSKRFALYAEEGVIKTLLVEDSPGELKKTGADDLLAAI